MSEPRARQPRRVTRPVERVPRLLLTRQEAAAALGMSVDTFERRVQPFIRVVPCGQLVLVPPAELERWVRERARFMVDRTTASGTVSNGHERFRTTKTPGVLVRHRQG